MRFITSSFFVCFILTFHAQNFDKLIEAEKYAKVLKKGKKTLAKNPDDVVSHYYLAVLYSTRTSGYYSIQTAYNELNLTKQNYFKIQDVKELNALAEIPITLVSLKQFNDSILQYAFSDACAVNTVLGYEEFLKTYENIPNELVQQTYLKRDHCAFTDAQKIATIDAYNSFILNYPKALDIPLAIKMRNALAFEQTKKKDDILSYTNFIKTYPDAVEVESAKKRIHEIAFEETKSKNTLEAYKNFITLYPGAFQTAEALTEIYKLAFTAAKAINNSTSYKAYLTEYPKSPFKDEAQALFELTEYREMTLNNTWEVYRDYIETHFKKAYYQDACSKLEEIALTSINPKPLLYCIDHHIGNENTLINKYYKQVSEDGELSSLIDFKNSFPSWLTKIPTFEQDLETAKFAKEIGLTCETSNLSINQEMNNRLKREGAKSGAVTISLMWNNYNDLDLHCVDPYKEEIFYKHKFSKSGGELDVDMNADDYNLSSEPVENIYWDNAKAKKGVYSIYVDFYEQKDCYTCYDNTDYIVVVRYNNVVKEFKGTVQVGTGPQLVTSINYYNQNFGDIQLTDENIKKLDTYIKQAAQKELGFIALQKLIASDLNDKNWASALKKMGNYTQYFSNSKKFQELDRILHEKFDQSILTKELKELNTELGDEYAPIISGDGRTIYFCGANRPDSLGGEDIYQSTKQNEIWTQPLVVDGISSADKNDAIMSVSIDGNSVIKFDNGKLGMIERTPTGWGNLTYLPEEINDCKWNGDAMLTEDGNTLIFASVRESDDFSSNFNSKEFYHATQGYFSDIYVSQRVGKTWSRPINLGEKINTTFIERSPFLHPDMKTLYFSSDGHGGIGKLDVYKSTRLADTCWDCWSEPINMGKEINTIFDDWGYRITTDGTTAFFSKRIKNSKSDNLYTINLPAHLRPEVVAKIEGKLMDRNNTPISAAIRWEDLESKKIIGTIQTDPTTGAFFIALPMGKNYGYFIDDSLNFPLAHNLDLRNKSEAMNIQQDIITISINDMINEGICIPMNNLFFESGDSKLLYSSIPELTRIADIIKKNNYSIQLNGHTDNVGNTSSNLKLSQDRAENVKKFMISLGVSPDKIVSKGFGSSKPIATNESEAGKALNRRVEIQFIKH